MPFSLALTAFITLAGQTVAPASGAHQRCAVVLAPDEADEQALQLRALVQASVSQLDACQTALMEQTQANAAAAREMGLDCTLDDVQCLRKLGAVLETDVVIGVSPSEGGAMRLVAVDTNSGAVLNDLTAPLGDNASARLANVRQAVTLLLRPERVLAQLRVEVVPDGAKVLVDGATVGTSPLTQPLALSPGEHEIEARVEGQDPTVERVTLQAGQEASIQLTVGNAQADGLDPVVVWGAAAGALGSIGVLAASGTLSVEALLSLSPETGSGEERQNLQLLERVLFGVAVVGLAGALVTGGIALNTLVSE